MKCICGERVERVPAGPGGRPDAAKYLPPGRGRPKGTLNKVGAQVKQNIIAVFEGLGGIEAMIRWAKKNRTEFYRLYGRLAPTTVMATVDVRDASEFTDSELARIVAGASGAGAAGETQIERPAGSVH